MFGFDWLSPAWLVYFDDITVEKEPLFVSLLHIYLCLSLHMKLFNQYKYNPANKCVVRKTKKATQNFAFHC